jgi:uncharacterized protein
MALRYLSPGVYPEPNFLKPQAKLETGVPGFVGFADAAPAERAPMGQPPVPTNTPVALHRKEEFDAKFKGRPDSFLAEAVTGFFDNGGVRCYVARADPDACNRVMDREKALKDAIAALEPLDDLDLLAIPDAMTLKPENNKSAPEAIEAIKRVQVGALNQCAKLGDRFAILDSLLADTEEGVLKWRNSLTRGQAEPVNGSLYYPWINVYYPGMKDQKGRLIPPCGHVAGIYARTDAKVGPFKAPANEELIGVTDLEKQIDNQIQDNLNPKGVNCLRAFPGRGIRVWGARTLSDEPDWRYVSVRRLFLTLRRWIDLNMAWAAFEPNKPRLWSRIQRELTTYLTKLLRDGALKGATPEQAFFVKCNAETNPPELREVGQVVTEIGLAPLAPAEFIVVRITHRAGPAENS